MDPQSKVARWTVVALTACALLACSDSLDPDRASVATVLIEPQTAVVAVGASIPLTVEVRDATGNLIQGRKVAWASEDESVASVSSSGMVTGRKIGTVQIAASAEGKSAIAEITVNPTPVVSVRLSPTSRDLLVGQTVQITAEPVDAQGNVLPGRPVTWTTSNSTIATVSTTGLVTALAPGGAIITANSEGKTSVATITVAAVPVATVVVTPSAPTVVVGQTAQLTAQARDVGGQPIAGRTISWFSGNVQVATVSSTGLVTAVSPGTATITATTDGKNGTATVTVNPKPVSAVIVSPSQTSVATGSTVQLTAQVTDDQGNPLSGRPVSYTSGNTQVATVSSSGLVTGVTPGAVTITAASEGKTGTAQITVTPIPVANVEITPSEPNVVVGQTVQLAATARSASGAVLPDRPTVWTSGAPGIATVSSTGLVTGLSPGTAVIFAGIDGIGASTRVTVLSVPVAIVDVAPPTATVPVGEFVQLTATPKSASGATLSGRLVGWTSSDEAVAIVSSTGRVSALKVGTATITASSEGKSGTSVITVTQSPQAPVATVNVTPPAATVGAGQTVTLTATTLAASGATLTGRAVTWSSSNTGVATVTQTGVVTGVSPGNATITATSEGKSGMSAITVTAAPAAPVATVTVAPSTLSLLVGESGPLTATTRDASNNVLTGRTVTWSSSNTNVATVSGGTGVVTAVAAGSATITATSEGKTGTAAVTVTAAPPPPVGTVTVAPSSETVNVAWTTTLTATVRDANGAVVPNATVAWSTSNGAVATVSQTGEVTGVSVGTATITASSGGRTGTATITVQLAPVDRVEVTPSSLTLRTRDDQRTGQLTTTLFDARNNILTGRTVTWTSSNPSVATVTQSGLVTAQDRGDATITAAIDGRSDTASIRVQN